MWRSPPIIACDEVPSFDFAFQLTPMWVTDQAESFGFVFGRNEHIFAIRECVS